MINSIISAAGSLLGGALSGEAQKDANQANAATQREFAQHGIRWKVEDAKAAGLHPLYALGGTGATFSPSFQSEDSAGQGLARGLANMGQNVSRSAKQMLSAPEQALIDAQIRAANASASRDEAQAQFTYQQAADLATQNNQFGTGAHASALSLVPTPRAAPLDRDLPGQQRGRNSGDSEVVRAQGAIKFKPSEITSHETGNPSQTAGRKPLFDRYTILDPNGRPRSIWIPTTNDPGETLSELGLDAGGALMLYENMRQNGLPGAGVLRHGQRSLENLMRYNPLFRAARSAAPRQSGGSSGRW